MEHTCDKSFKEAQLAVIEGQIMAPLVYEATLATSDCFSNKVTL